MKINKIEYISRNYLEPLRKMEAMEGRMHQEEGLRSRADGPFQRDYSRIMYASSFRRLQGKMQLLGIKEDQFFRNRLTHSLEVAQIARSLAMQFGYEKEEIYVVEAGALAHDLGNPPFGHSGERKLNELFQEIGGFEGNAQTLRILTTVEKKRPQFRGLNLTYRTLFGVAKYFTTLPTASSNKFIYQEDYEMLLQFLKCNGLMVRTLDVQIVDIADEIAYAAHDLEDGLRQDCFTIDEILHEYQSRYGESESYRKLVEIVGESRQDSGYGTVKNTATQYSKMFRQELTSKVVNTLIEDVEMLPLDERKKKKTGSAQNEELQFRFYQELASGLKDITFQCINQNYDVYLYEQKGNEILAYLFEHYKKYENCLPPEYRAKDVIRQYRLENFGTEAAVRDRLICDYISGMMDSYAISTYEKFKNLNLDLGCV